MFEKLKNCGLVTFLSHIVIISTLICNIYFFENPYSTKAPITLIIYAIGLALKPSILISSDRKFCFLFVVCAVAGVFICVIA